MKQLKELQEQINIAQIEICDKTSALKHESYKVFKELMKSRQDLVKDMLSKVESSKELTLSEFNGWPVQWTRVDFSVLNLDLNNDFIKDLLVEYFSEYSIEIDFKNDCLSMNQGPSIVINHDGDVYDQDSGKSIIQSNDYNSIDDRNSQIEKWMDKHGYFPSVIQVDKYENVKYINTQNKTKV